MFELHPQLKQDSIELGELDLCKLLLINDSHYPWFVLVPMRSDIKEAYQLSDNDQIQLHRESILLSNKIMHAFQGDKLNVAALGNMVPQLHVHHIVRFSHDAAWPAPIWGKHPLTPYTPGQLSNIKAKLIAANITGLRLCD